MFSDQIFFTIEQASTILLGETVVILEEGEKPSENNRNYKLLIVSIQFLIPNK